MHSCTSTSSFIPTKPGTVGGTLNGASFAQKPQRMVQARQTFEGQKLGEQAASQSRPEVQSKPFQPPTPPEPKQQEKPPVSAAVPPQPTPEPKAQRLPINLIKNESEAAKPASQSVPQRTTFNIPQKTSSVNNIVEDKLNKTVNIPSERKRYVVDPYREPLE